MALAFTSSGSGGSGTVKSVTAGDTSVVVGGTATDPTVATASLDVIAADHATAGSVAMNAHKITGLANGAAASDAAAFGQIPTALPPNGAAGGDLGGTYPNPTATSGAHLGAATVPIAALADPTTGKVIGSDSSAAAAVFPPGYELNYTEVTSTVNISGTTSATATTVISPPAITFDGAPVIVEVFAPAIRCDTGAATDLFKVSLFEGSTEIGILGFLKTVATAATSQAPLYCGYRFTPTAGSHTYIVKCYATSATGPPQFIAGAGGTNTQLPAFVRFTKV